MRLEVWTGRNHVCGGKAMGAVLSAGEGPCANSHEPLQAEPLNPSPDPQTQLHLSLLKRILDNLNKAADRYHDHGEKGFQLTK